MKFASSLLLRLSLGTLLLLGLCLTLGISVHPAHAQSTLTVTDCSSDSQLQADISQANTDNANDTITFTCSGDIKLTSTLTITGTMTIDGSGQSVSFDGGNSMQILSVSSSVSLTLNALTVAHGSISGNGGGLANNGGTVIITNSTFTNNSVPTNSSGGAIYNTGSLTISDSTFTGTTGYFGTVYNTHPGNVKIIGSTFANNSPQYGGGGLYNDIGGTATITNSTFTNNSGDYGAGLFDNFGTATITNSTIANNTGYGFGGGIATIGGSSAIVNISGSIVANNSGGDCQNYGTLNDNGYNLDSDSTCFTSSTSLHTNPQLSGLADNGGPTQTMALQEGSPAIDVIPLTANICPTTDQRGDARPDVDSPAETMCDMGAYESNYTSVDNDLGLTNMPANITTAATSPQGATVSYTPPTATDESGDPSTPSVSCTPTSGSIFPIGTTTVTCTATDSDDINSPVSASFTVTVSPVLTANGTNVNSTEGGSFNGVVATGTYYGVGTPSASIDWGDSNTSSGNVTLNGDGSYSVTGSHTYAEEGSFVSKVTVSGNGVPNAIATGSASVSDAPLKVTVFTATIKAKTLTLKTTFTDTDPNGTIGDYTASINWGDSTSSVGTIGSRGTNFTETATHKYRLHGTYIVTLTIKDVGGSSVTRILTIQV